MKWRFIGLLLVIAGIIIIWLFIIKVVPYEMVVTKKHDILKDYRITLAANRWTPYNTTLTPSKDSYKVNGTLKLIEPDLNYIDFCVVNRTTYEWHRSLMETDVPWGFEYQFPNHFLQGEIRNQCDFTLVDLNYAGDADYYFLFGVSNSHDQEIELTITEYWQAIESFWDYMYVLIIPLILFGVGIFLLLRKPRKRRLSKKKILLCSTYRLGDIQKEMVLHKKEVSSRISSSYMQQKEIICNNQKILNQAPIRKREQKRSQLSLSQIL